MFTIIWNIIDVLLVAFIIYRLVLLIKGTRAMSVMWGLVILAILTVLVHALKLQATEWLFQRVWLAGMVLLVVVFQPELRVALAELGSRPLGRILESHEFDFISEMMGAVRQCSKTKTGFLVVLEQETGLRDIVKTGTTLNADISKELLLTIFFPNTLLHDGAVIVANSRIVAAGCILPVASDDQISKIFGMRHRAAIGISESSDAIAIVVSEETGSVSLVRGGKIQTEVDPDEIEKRLYDLYKSKAEKGLLRKSPRN